MQHIEQLARLPQNGGVISAVPHRSIRTVADRLANRSIGDHSSERVGRVAAHARCRRGRAAIGREQPRRRSLVAPVLSRNSTIRPPRSQMENTDRPGIGSTRKEQAKLPMKSCSAWNGIWRSCIGKRVTRHRSTACSIECSNSRAKGSEETLIHVVKWLTKNQSWDVLDTFLESTTSRALLQSKRPLYYAALARSKQGKNEFAEQLATDAAADLHVANGPRWICRREDMEEHDQFEWAVREYRKAIEKQPSETSETFLARIYRSQLAARSRTGKGRGRGARAAREIGPGRRGRRASCTTRFASTTTADWRAPGTGWYRRSLPFLSCLPIPG